MFAGRANVWCTDSVVTAIIAGLQNLFNPNGLRNHIKYAKINLNMLSVCRLDKLLGWFSTQTSVVNFLYDLFCLCIVRRQYLLPGILGIYCFLTGVPSLPAIALPKGRICSLVNQVYTSFPLMSLPPFGLQMLVKCC